MSFDQWLSMGLFTITMAITPGPNNAMLMASGVNHGIKSSIPHFLGINLGFPVMVIVMGMGIGSIFDQYPIIHKIIQIAGALYLIYLAWLIGTTTESKLDQKSSKPLTFKQAAIFQWINPKAWVIIAVAMAAYTNDEENIYLQVSIMALTFVFLGSPCSMVWLACGRALKNLLKSSVHLRAFNITMALLLVSSLVPVIIDWFRE